jgi:uncharacterized protein YjbI with pentapeptide repeats
MMSMQWRTRSAEIAGPEMSASGASMGSRPAAAVCTKLSALPRLPAARAKHRRIWIGLVLMLTLSTAIGAAEQVSPQPPVIELPPDPSVTVATGATTQAASLDQAVASCPYCDMRGADLSGQDLTDANLTGANLSGANLKGAKLNGASLIGADLSHADLSNAELNPSAQGPADLSRANLLDANLDGAQMVGTDLQFARMGGASFKRVNLEAAVFGPRIDTAHPQGHRVSFTDARLRREFEADSARMDLAGVSWAGAEVAQAADDGQTACGRADLSGLSSRIYVANDGTDDASCGSAYDKSCRTIAQGLQRCSGSACGVLVRWDVYPQTTSIALRDGVSLYGGCLPQVQARPEYFSAVLGPAGGAPVMSATGVNSATLLQGFQLAASKAPPLQSASSVALSLVDSRALSLADMEVVADEGGSAGPSGNGTPGTGGGNGSGRTGGTVSACSGTTGGAGAVKRNVSVDVGFASATCKPSCSENGCAGFYGSPASTGFWAPGGTRGGDNCTECPRSRGDTGQRGTDGRHASCGGKGTVSASISGSFDGLRWYPSQGGRGGTGGEGGGAGGGGAGGYKAGACFWVKTEDAGNPGGGGGAGGCRGGVGNGGSQGGPSFAVMAVRSTLNLVRTRLVAGSGGSGANGGAGAAGGRGGSGASGASNESGGYGGQGGTGGAGGAGGGGAGGNGGPALGVALVSGSSVTGTPTYYLGKSGNVGEPGRGGTPIVSDACTASNGDSGVRGLVAETHSY